MDWTVENTEDFAVFEAVLDEDDGVLVDALNGTRTLLEGVNVRPEEVAQ